MQHAHVLHRSLLILTLAACGDTTSGTDDTTAGTTDATESGSETGSETETTAAEVDEDAVLDDVMNFDQEKFTKANNAPLASQHGDMAMVVDIWVPPDVLATYKMIDPMDYQPITFPVGTTLIKRHWADAEATMPGGWTVMHKGPPGYAPDTGDWWWARVYEDGTTPVKGTAPAADFCISCHMPAAPSDWARGIDAADQVP